MPLKELKHREIVMHHLSASDIFILLMNVLSRSKLDSEDEICYCTNSYQNENHRILVIYTGKLKV